MRMRKSKLIAAVLTAAFVVAALAAPATAIEPATTQWQEGTPYDGGPSCDWNGINEDPHGYFNPAINYDYRLIGTFDDDGVFNGRYEQRYDAVPFFWSAAEPAPDGEYEDIVVTGRIVFDGQIKSDDFSDPQYLKPVGDEFELSWQYKIYEKNGDLIEHNSGKIVIDPAIGEIIDQRSVGSCSEP